MNIEKWLHKKRNLIIKIALSLTIFCFYDCLLDRGHFNANKRTGFMSAHVFLKINGYELNADQESSEQLTVKVATFIGDFEVLKSEVAHFFKKYAYLKE